jgi:hypothetical protein
VSFTRNAVLDGDMQIVRVTNADGSLCYSFEVTVGPVVPNMDRTLTAGGMINYGDRSIRYAIVALARSIIWPLDWSGASRVPWTDGRILLGSRA